MSGATVRALTPDLQTQKSKWNLNIKKYSCMSRLDGRKIQSWIAWKTGLVYYLIFFSISRWFKPPWNKAVAFTLATPRLTCVWLWPDPSDHSFIIKSQEHWCPVLWCWPSLLGLLCWPPQKTWGAMGLHWFYILLGGVAISIGNVNQLSSIES